MTAAKAGIGTEFQVGDAASPEVFTKVAEVLTISGPELSSEEVEVTSLDSPNGFKEFIAGLKDGGSIQFDMNWIKSNANQVLLRDRVGGATFNYRIVWSDSPATQVDVAAQVTAFTMSTEPTSAIGASVTVTISGAPTWS